MARLGELLIAAQLLDAEQIERALRAQVMWGGRLGTNLVELGLLDLESITRALGRQHGLPAALARHFDKADPELQERLPPELAERWSAIPLFHVGPQKAKIAVAVLDPLPLTALAQIADALLCPRQAIIISVAAEMRVRYHLERVYGIARTARYLRSRGRNPSPFPNFDNIPVPIDSDVEVAVPIAVDESAHPTGRASVEEIAAAPEPPPPAEPAAESGPLQRESAEDIARLIDEAIAQATAVEPTEPVGRERRSYVRLLGDAPPPPASPATTTHTLARVAIKKVPASAPPPVEPARTLAATLAEAVRAIRRASHRDQIVALAIEAVQRFVPTVQAAVLLYVRGDVAISWKSFSRTCTPSGDLVVPLDSPGLVPTVVAKNAVARASAGELGAIDQALLRSIGELRGDLVIVPIAIADNVMGMIASATEPDAPIEGVEAVAGAAAVAFARLIRDASR